MGCSRRRPSAATPLETRVQPWGNAARLGESGVQGSSRMESPACTNAETGSKDYMRKGQGCAWQVQADPAASPPALRCSSVPRVASGHGGLSSIAGRFASTWEAIPAAPPVQLNPNIPTGEGVWSMCPTTLRPSLGPTPAAALARPPPQPLPLHPSKQSNPPTPLPPSVQVRFKASS